MELDRDRLKRALAEERKRKDMGEDEAWAKSKKAKTDVTQEELGMFFFMFEMESEVSIADYLQRLTD